MGQGPAPLTVGTMVREFYDQEHVPILYIDMDSYLPKLKIEPEARSKLLYGTHYIAGRIEDIPVQGDYGHAESVPPGPVPENKGLAGLGQLGYSGSLSLGSWIPDWPTAVDVNPPGRPTRRSANNGAKRGAIR